MHIRVSHLVIAMAVSVVLLLWLILHHTGQTVETTCTSVSYEPAYIVLGFGVAGATTVGTIATLDPSAKVLVINAGSNGQSFFGARLPNKLDWPGLDTRGLTTSDVPGEYRVLNDGCFANPNSIRGCPVNTTRLPSGVYQPMCTGGAGAVNGTAVQYPLASDFATWPTYMNSFAKLRDDYAFVASAFQTSSGAINQPWTQTPSADGLNYGDFHSGVAQVRSALLPEQYVENTERYVMGINEHQPGTLNLPSLAVDDDGLRMSPATVFLQNHPSWSDYDEDKKASTLRLMSNAEVSEIHRNPVTQHIDRMTITRSGKHPCTIHLTVSNRTKVIFACGALSTTYLMLKNGLGGDDVGRRVYDHPVGLVTFEDPAKDLLVSRDTDRAKTDYLKVDRVGLFTQYDPVLFAYTNVNAARETNVEYFVNPPGPMSVTGTCFFFLLRQAAYAASFVYDPTMDKLVIRGTISLGPEATAAQEEAGTAMASLLGDAGMEKVRSIPFVGHGNHWMSTIPLGGSTLPENRGLPLVRGTRNLYITDASIFPGNVSCHPWLSVAALAVFATRQIIGSTLRTTMPVAIFGQGGMVVRTDNGLTDDGDVRPLGLGSNITWVQEVKGYGLIALDEDNSTVYHVGLDNTVRVLPILGALKRPVRACVYKHIVYVVCFGETGGLDTGVATYNLSTQSTCTHAYGVTDHHLHNIYVCSFPTGRRIVVTDLGNPWLDPPTLGSILELRANGEYYTFLSGSHFRDILQNDATTFFAISQEPPGSDHNGHLYKLEYIADTDTLSLVGTFQVTTGSAGDGPASLFAGNAKNTCWFTNRLAPLHASQLIHFNGEQLDPPILTRGDYPRFAGKLTNNDIIVINRDSDNFVLFEGLASSPQEPCTTRVAHSGVHLPKFVLQSILIRL
jgi:choline dehydrogenase-like flavoprotein